MVASRISKSVALVFVVVGAAACAPAVTIADETGDGGEGGGLGTSGSGGTDSSGGQGASVGTGGMSSTNGGIAGAGALSGTGGGAASECKGEVSEGKANYSLQDYCEMRNGCPESVDEAVTRLGEVCGRRAVIVVTGCGARWVAHDGPPFGEGFLFDEASGKLIAAYDVRVGSAEPYGPCPANFYYGGVYLPYPDSCLEATQCEVCEDSLGLVCRFDCDCNESPGVDPCHDPSSCGCYCERLAHTTCRDFGNC
jgi:hypothetical protein